jgi:hypothetical protein
VERMQMSEYAKNVESKIAKARKCQDLLLDVEGINDFKKYFHIRVNANNFVIVCTLEGKHANHENGYFMNGITCKTDELPDKVKLLTKNIPDKNADDIDLEALEFPHRKDIRRYREYKDQAIFIRALCGDEKYSKMYKEIKNQLGIDEESELKFVASEFTLFSKEDENNESIAKLNKRNAEKSKYKKYKYNKNRRIDVLGECDGILYYFELKKNGEVYNDVFSQIDDYKNYYQIRRKEVQALLKEYPLFSTSYIEEQFVVINGTGDIVDIEKINELFESKDNINENGEPIIPKSHIIAFKESEEK